MNKPKSNKMNLKLIPIFLIMMFSIQSASATTIGTSLDEVVSTYFTGQFINVTQIHLGNGTNGFGNYSGNRPLVSNSAVSVTVCDSGCNFTHINMATRQIPYFLYHQYIITVQSPYTAYEHVYLPPSIVASDMSSADIAANGVILRGNVSNYSEIEIQSVHVISNTGATHPVIRDFKITGNDINSNENTSVMVVGSKDVLLGLLNFTGANASAAVVAYSSGVSLQQIDLGSSLEYGFMSKHTGTFHFEPCLTCQVPVSPNVSSSYNVIGNVSKYIYLNYAGVPFGFSRNGAVAGLGIAYPDRAPIFDMTNNIAYGIEGYGNDIDMFNYDINNVGVIESYGTSISGSYGGTNETIYSITPITLNDTRDAVVKLFRYTNTTGSRAVNLYRGNDSSDISIQLDPGNGRIKVGGKTDHGLSITCASISGSIGDTCTNSTTGIQYYYSDSGWTTIDTDTLGNSCDYSYCIRLNGSTVEAVNGTNGSVEYSGTNFSLVYLNTFSAMPKNGHIYIASGNITIPSQINMNLAGARGFKLVSDAIFTPTAGIGTAFNITNGYDVEIKLRFDAGGQSTDSALFLRGIREGHISVNANNYGGTVLNISVNASGEPKTAKIVIDSLVTQNVYRSIALYGDGSVYSSACCQILEGFWFNSTVPAYFYNYGDITLGNIEGGSGNAGGIIFDQITSLFVDSLWFGDESHTKDLITITGGSNLHFSKVGVMQGKTGINISGITAALYGQGVTISDLWTYDNINYGLLMTDVRYSDINLHSASDGVGLKINGSSSLRNRVLLNVLNSEHSGIEIESGVSRLSLSGRISNSNSSLEAGNTYGAYINSTGLDLDFTGLTIEEAATNGVMYLLPDNKVKWHGGYSSLLTTVFPNARPYSIINVQQLSPFNYGLSTSCTSISGSIGDTCTNSTTSVHYTYNGSAWVQEVQKEQFEYVPITILLDNGSNPIGTGYFKGVLLNSVNGTVIYADMITATGQPTGNINISLLYNASSAPVYTQDGFVTLNATPSNATASKIIALNGNYAPYVNSNSGNITNVNVRMMVRRN